MLRRPKAPTASPVPSSSTVAGSGLVASGVAFNVVVALWVAVGGAPLVDVNVGSAAPDAVVPVLELLLDVLFDVLLAEASSVAAAEDGCGAMALIDELSSAVGS